MAKGYNWEYISNRLSNVGSEIQTFAERQADELLRYTYLGMANMSKRASLYLTYKREFDIKHKGTKKYMIEQY